MSETSKFLMMITEGNLYYNKQQYEKSAKI